MSHDRRCGTRVCSRESGQPPKLAHGVRLLALVLALALKGAPAELVLGVCRINARDPAKVEDQVQFPARTLLGTSINNKSGRFGPLRLTA